MSGADATIPPATARLLAGYDPRALLAPAGRSLLCERLLEDGDRNDLAWLFARLPRAEIVAFLDGPGSRRLSRRSHAWLCLLLDLEPAARPPNPFWPG